MRDFGIHKASEFSFSADSERGLVPDKLFSEVSYDASYYGGLSSSGDVVHTGGKVALLGEYFAGGNGVFIHAVLSHLIVSNSWYLVFTFYVCYWIHGIDKIFSHVGRSDGLTASIILQRTSRLLENCRGRC